MKTPLLVIGLVLLAAYLAAAVRVGRSGSSRFIAAALAAGAVAAPVIAALIEVVLPHFTGWIHNNAPPSRPEPLLDVVGVHRLVDPIGIRLLGGLFAIALICALQSGHAEATAAR